MLSATPTIVFHTDSYAKCAYLVVVANLRWPGGLPIIGKPSPVATTRDAFLLPGKVFRRHPFLRFRSLAMAPALDHDVRLFRTDDKKVEAAAGRIGARISEILGVSYVSSVWLGAVMRIGTSAKLIPELDWMH